MQFSSGKLFRKVKQNLFDCDEILKDCDAFGVDLQTLMTVPVMFNYDLDPTTGVEWSRFLNQHMKSRIDACSDKRRFVGFGTLPLQNPIEA